MDCHKYPPQVFHIKDQKAVGVSKFANSYSSILYAPLSHPFKPSSWFEMLSLPTLIYVAILSVLQRPLLFFSLPSFYFSTTHTQLTLLHPFS